MKLKTIIKEVISEQIFEEMLKTSTKCVGLFKLNKLFYRGISSDHSIGGISKILPRKRNSKDTNNFANVLFDGYNESSEKRTYGTIFTNSKGDAESYGEVRFVIIPDSANITYGIASDNYNNFRNGVELFRSFGIVTIKDIEDFNIFIMDLLIQSGLYQRSDISEIDKLMDFDVLIEAIKSAISQLKKTSADIEEDRIRVFIQNEVSNDVEGFFKKVFNSDLNQIKTVPMLGLEYSSLPNNVEIWSSSYLYLLSPTSSYVSKLNLTIYNSYKEDEDRI